MCSKGLFPPQELFPKDQEPFEKHIPLYAFPPDEPGSKCSSVIVVLPHRKVPGQGVVLSEAPGTIRVGPAAQNITDWSNTLTQQFTHLAFLKTR